MRKSALPEQNAFYEWTIRADDAERRIARAIRICAGNHVREMYGDLLNEPIPPKLADLLSRLDRRTALGPSLRKARAFRNGRDECLVTGETNRGGQTMKISGVMSRDVQLGRVLINAGIDRTSALGANRICRDGGIDENDPEPPIGCQFAVMHNRRRPQM